MELLFINRGHGLKFIHSRNDLLGPCGRVGPSPGTRRRSCKQGVKIPAPWILRGAAGSAMQSRAVGGREDERRDEGALVCRAVTKVTLERRVGGGRGYQDIWEKVPQAGTVGVQHPRGGARRGHRPSEAGAGRAGRRGAHTGSKSRGFVILG